MPQKWETMEIDGRYFLYRVVPYSNPQEPGWRIEITERGGRRYEWESDSVVYPTYSEALAAAADYIRETVVDDVQADETGERDGDLGWSDPGEVPPDEGRSALKTIALMRLPASQAGDELHVMCSDESHRDRPATHALVGPDPEAWHPAYVFEPVCAECAERTREHLRTRDE
jgi:hypothetical protein